MTSNPSLQRTSASAAGSPAEFKREISMPHFSRSIHALLIFGIGLPNIALALCLEGKASTAAREANTAVAVVVATPISERPLMDDQEDPVGVTGTEYHVSVRKVLKGHASQNLVVRTDNTSSRFPITLREPYLLFLTRDFQGHLFVDACGASGPLAERRHVLRALKK